MIIEREKGLLWKCRLLRSTIFILYHIWSLQQKDSYLYPPSLPCSSLFFWTYVSKIRMRNFMDADDFSACYLWHKNKCCPFAGTRVEPSWARAEAEHGRDASVEATEQFRSSDLLRHSTAPRKDRETFLIVKSLSQQAEWDESNESKNLREVHREVLRVCFIRCGVAEHSMVETQFSL